MTVAACIPAKIPAELCAIDDEIKAIYHSADSVCIWTFRTREDRNAFMERTIGMTRAERSAVFEEYAAGG